MLRQRSRDLSQSQAAGRRTGQPLPCPLQCWRESQAATADLVLCRNDSDRIGLHILLLSHPCDGASTQRKPSQQLPCRHGYNFPSNAQHWTGNLMHFTPEEDRRKYIHFYSSNHKVHTEEKGQVLTAEREQCCRKTLTKARRDSFVRYRKRKGLRTDTFPTQKCH